MLFEAIVVVMQAAMQAVWWMVLLSLRLAWGLIQAAWVITTAVAAFTRAAALWSWRQVERLREVYRRRRMLGPWCPGRQRAVPSTW